MFNKELQLINNLEYKKNVEILLNLLPPYFYEIEAASTGKYHPKFASGKNGLVRHTKAAVRIAFELMNNDTVSNFSSDEKDLIIIALLLHDGLKKGFNEEEYTKFEHSLIVATFIKDNKDKLSFTEEETNLLCNMIASHMGQWNTNKYSNINLPLPKTKYERFVHMCDFLASRKFLDVKFDSNNDIEE